MHKRISYLCMPTIRLLSTEVHPLPSGNKFTKDMIENAPAGRAK